MDFSTFKTRHSSVLAFSLGFVGVMIIMTLMSLGFRPSKILGNLFSTTAEEKSAGQGNESKMQEISKKLNFIKHDFKLYKKTSLIPQAYSAAEFHNAKAYTSVNFETGEIINESASQEKLPIASLTKVMTAVVALDLADPDEKFTVSKRAARQVPTKIGVVPGEKMSLRELLNAVLLTSANDAAEVVREGINEKYGENIFVESMNLKAKALGLSDSSFQNPQGFDSRRNFSSARDLVLLTHYALSNYPLFAEIVKKDFEFLPHNENHKQFDLYNWNGLIGVYPNVSGVKIGNTDRAGKTTIVVSEREGKKVIAVVLGAPGVRERDMWAAELLDASFKDAFGFEPVKITEEDLTAKYGKWRFWN